jgi:hypothetical protein
MTTRALEKKLDNAPSYATNTARLIEWSRNYESYQPYRVFLDLIGYSVDNYGEPLTRVEEWSLGYLELDYISDALGEYIHRPADIRDFIDELTRAEMSDDDGEEESED